MKSGDKVWIEFPVGHSLEIELDGEVTVDATVGQYDSGYMAHAHGDDSIQYFVSRHGGIVFACDHTTGIFDRLVGRVKDFDANT